MNRKRTQLGIVGEDNLVDVSELSLYAGVLYERLERAAPSIGILIPRGDIVVDSNGAWWVDAAPMTISGSRFEGSPSLPLSKPATFFCVGHELLVGAAHTFPVPDSTDDVIAFDLRFDQWQAGPPGTEGRFLLRPEQLFAITGAQIWAHSSTQGDAVLVGCRPEFAASRLPPPLPLASAETIGERGLLAMMGYPRGLPLKACIPFPGYPHSAPRARALDGPTLRSTLDTFQGNSGSPVFNERGEVVAVHNGGGADTQDNGQVSVLREGSAVSRATVIDVLAPALGRCGIAVRA